MKIQKTKIVLKVVFVSLFLSLFNPLVAQDDDCHPHFKGSDKSDFEKGVEAYNNKRYQQCITLMRKVSAKNRTAADPYFYMGIAAVKAGERPAVIKNHFTRLFKLCPDYPNALAYYYMAIVHYTYKEYPEAVVQLNKYFDIANQQPNPAYDAVYEEASTYLYWSEFLADAQQNQVPFFPTVLRGASSGNDEYLPFLTHDGSEIYYLRKVAEQNPNGFYGREMADRKLRLFCSRWKDTAFNTGSQLTAPFNMEGDEGCVTLTADNRTLYYSVLRHDKGYDNCDIWYCHRKKGEWQKLENAGHNVNGERTWESQPSITPDGQYLYFASNRAGGQGGTDIWVCRRLPNGDWSRAENLGPAVNTPGNEKCPFIHADSKTLYFASDGWQGFGGYDIYFINLNDTYLQRPTNLGLPINSEGDDVCMGVTSDGKRGYFANKSTEWKGIGGTDIFTFELYPSAQPEEMTVVKAQLKDNQGKPLSGTVQVLRQKAGADHYIIDEEGIIALSLSARGTNTVIVNSEGCMPRIVSGNAHTLQRDLNAADFVMHTAELWGRYPMPLPKNGRNLLPLNKEATAALDAITDFMLKNPRMHIRIDATTVDEAKAIFDYLLSRQLRTERLEYKANSALANPQIVITNL